MDRQDYARRLAWPKGPVDLVIDTDAGNQIDDQFAIAYALLSAGRLNVQALYAAPFVRGRHITPRQGMQASYRQILHMVELVEKTVAGCRQGRTFTRPAVFAGAGHWCSPTGTAVPSPASRDLVDRARSARQAGRLLYVVGLAAVTNIASALMMEPQLRQWIVVVWLGGQKHEAPSAREFNLAGDVAAARFLFDCGVPLVHIPCRGVAEALCLNAEQVRSQVAGGGPVGRALAEMFFRYYPVHPHPRKVIWDLSAVGWLVNGAWLPSKVVDAPRLRMDMTWQHAPDRHPMRVITACRAQPIFDDFFNKLEKYATGTL